MAKGECGRFDEEANIHTRLEGDLVVAVFVGVLLSGNVSVPFYRLS